VKPLVARSPARLGPARAWELAWSGMRFRLFRSSVTVAILALAVAFLAHTAAHGLLGSAVRVEASRELEQSRALGRYLTRLSTPDSPATVRSALAAGEPARLAEYRAWGALTEADLAAARDAAARLAALTAALDRLPPAARAVVLADESADDVAAALADPAARSALAARLDRAGARVAEAAPASLAALGQSLPVLERVVALVIAGHERATRALAAACAPETLRAVAARAPAGFAARARAAGFTLPEEEAAALGAYAARREDLGRVGRLLLEPEVRSVVARELDVPVGDVGLEVVVARVRSGRRLAWLAGALAPADAAGGLTAARLGELFAAHRREQRLVRTLAGAGVTAGAAGADAGVLPVRTLVLVGLSFLVCVVGVMNAMLMSVTERFSEIATMKCLGGRDGFIMGLFVFEAVIQGLLGGAVGGLAGLLLALLRGLLEHGALLGAAAGAAGSLLLAVGAAAALGVVLAALGAIGPAWLAARLAPMEAMRVD